MGVSLSKNKIGISLPHNHFFYTSQSFLYHLHIGAILYSFPASCYPTEPASAADWADMVDGLQKAALESRLGIPIIQMCDSVHGHGNVFGTTVFPHNIGLGATRQVLLYILQLMDARIII